MIKFDFNTMVDSFIDKENYNSLISRKDEVYSKFNDAYMTGWTKPIDVDELNEILRVRDEVLDHSECLVVIGIGGSFLGSYAVEKMLSPYFNNYNFEVIYAGTTLSSKYMNELLDYLRDKDFSINVISKSGTTMETTITYKLLKGLLEEKYSGEDLVKRIIVTTDAVKGSLREEVNKVGYPSFVIPDDVGGRYSIMTAAHLFPLSFNIELEDFLNGYYSGEDLREEAFKYAATRVALYNSGKVVENYVTYEENMYYFTEWLKQLYGESEGKEGVGIFPVSTVHTRDLHSLGQFIQEGNKIIFETFMKVENSDEVIYNGKNLHEVNNIVLDSVRSAHKLGNVPSLEISLERVDEATIGQLMYFYMLGAAFSGFLFNIDPFNQPGVEVYKKEVRENLGVL